MSQLFIDIETVRQHKELPEKLRNTYIKKFEKELVSGGDYTSPEHHYRERAALYAEFGKIVCISIGAVHEGKFKVKSIYGEDEVQILNGFIPIAQKATSMVAHNGMEFDFPWLFRRMVIHGMPVPKVLISLDKKPWEMTLEDTVKMWSGTAWNYKCSLSLLAECLGLPNPKDNMEGSKVGEMYYSSDPDNLKKIVTYCNGDVVTLANVYRRIRGFSSFTYDQIIYT